MEPDVLEQEAYDFAEAMLKKTAEFNPKAFAGSGVEIQKSLVQAAFNAFYEVSLKAKRTLYRLDGE